MIEPVVEGTKEGKMQLRSWILPAVAMLTGSMLAGAEITKLECTQEGPTKYHITGNTHEVRIFSSADPAGLGQMKELLKTADTSKAWF